MKYLKLNLLIAICFFSLNIRAQENNWYEKEFSAYTEYLLNQYGIKWLSPEEFSEQGHYYVFWKVSKEPPNHSGKFYGPIFVSPNEDCQIMYSGRPYYITMKEIEIANTFVIIERVLNSDTSNIELDLGTREDFPRSQITAEITTTLGLYYHPHSPLNNDSAQYSSWI